MALKAVMTQTYLYVNVALLVEMEGICCDGRNHSGVMGGTRGITT